MLDDNWVSPNDAIVIPDLPAPIKAWRVFRLVRHTGRLTGSMGVEWPEDLQLTATCARNACDDPPCSPSVAWRDRRRYMDWCRRHQVAGFGDAAYEPVPSVHNVGKGCGIYAYKRRSDVIKEAAKMGLSGPWETHIARVWLWGKVYEHEYGYRAQHCRVQALYLYEKAAFDSWDEELQRLRAKLSVPVLVWQD